MAAVASVFGNTAEPLARANHHALAALCGYTGPILAGAPRALGPETGRNDAALPEASRFLVTGPGPWRVIALGPLTDLGAAMAVSPEVTGRVAEVVCVGSNRTSRGRWPPWWPHEFNLTQDGQATRAVFESGVPLTLVPLDVARGLTVTPPDLAALPGALGDHLRRHSIRWFQRAVWLRGRRVFPIWDLVAALYVIDPGQFEVETGAARLHAGGWIEHGAGTRPLTVVRAFDRDALWRRFSDLVAAAA